MHICEDCCAHVGLGYGNCDIGLGFQQPSTVKTIEKVLKLKLDGTDSRLPDIGDLVSSASTQPGNCKANHCTLSIWSMLQLVHCQTGTLSNWYTVQLVHCQTGTLSNWYIVQLVHCPTGALSNWYIIQLVHCPTSTLSN